MIVVPVVAFGRWFVEAAQYLLRSLDSPGNLPDVASRLIVYTDTPEAFPGREVVHLTPKEMQRRSGVRGSKHHLTSSCYADALALGHPIAPFAADMVCAAGTLAALNRLAATHRVVLAPVVRTVAQSMRAALGDGPIALAPRELVALALQHLHPLQQKMYWENLPSDMAPTTIFRRSGDTISAHCFHIHPLLLRLEPGTPLSAGIDGELMARMNPAECHLVTDSDELVVFDLTDAAYNWSSGFRKRFPPGDPVLHWVDVKANRMHCWFFEHECLIHAGEPERPAPDASFEQFRADVRALAKARKGA